jgi:hypothetical protein
MHLLGYFYQYYYLVLILQAICVFHCMRKGNSQQWIWLIVFLPAIGCLIYLFTEIITKKDVGNVTNAIDTVVRPTGRIKDLERNFDFSPSYENRLELAKAYSQNNRTDEALKLLEEGKQGVFANDPQLNMCLIAVYAQNKQHSEICEIAPQLKNHPDFQKSSERILYALALESLGNANAAEQELMVFKSRYSDFEGKYNYASFLVRNNRKNEAIALLEEVESESSKMTRGERRNHNYWIREGLNLLGDLKNRN